MNIRVVLLSAVCVAYFAASASGLSLLAAGAAAKLGLIKGAVLGAGLAGLSQPASETVIINAESDQAVNVPPVQVVQYQPIPQSQGIFGGLWSVIQNAIISKTRAVGSLINALAPSPQQQVIIVVNNTDTTTTTTTTTQRPIIYGVIGVGSPILESEVLINTAPCLNCYY